jgi:hypothetical protein
MKLLFPFLMSVFPLASLTQSQPPSPQPPSGAPSPKTTEMMVILTATAGVTCQQMTTIMPVEIRATVKLYLDGKIRQWYSRGDGKGVVLFLDARTVEEAHAIMETLPLSKENLMEHEYIPGSPLMPLAGLLGRGPTRNSRGAGCAPVLACSPIRRAHENKTRRSTCHQKPSSGFISL